MLSCPSARRPDDVLRKRTEGIGRVRSSFSNALWRIAMLAGAFWLLPPPAQAATAVGDRIAWPETRLLDGRVLRNADLRGKPVVVVFWATWCPICAEELPWLDALRQRRGGRDLEIVALSVDDSEIDAQRYWNAHHHTMPAAMRSPEHRAIFGPVTGTPMFVILDREGVIREIHVGRLPVAEFEALVEALSR